MAQLTLKSILSNISYYTNDAIVITDAQPVDEAGPVIVFVNPTFTHVTGYHASEVIGKSPRLLQGPGTSQSTKNDIYQAIKAWRPITTEILNYKKDGTPFWNELSIVPVADDTGWYRYWIAIQRDTTDLRQHQRDLNLRSLAMDVSTNAIAVCELAGDAPLVVYGNKPFMALVDGIDEPPGLAFLKLLPGERRDEVILGLRAAVDFGRIHTCEGPITSPTGGALYVRISIEPVPPELSGAKMLLISIRDKTEEQAQKQQIAETQRLRAIGQMTGGIAHDFNNLLTIVTHCSEILLAQDGLTDDARGLIQTIAQTADRGASLTSQLLSFARRRPLETEQIALRPFLERLHAVLRMVIPSTITVELSISENLSDVRTDPAQLETALLNLAINARDAIQSRGVIRLVATNKTVDAETSRHRDICEGNYVSLAVIDDGPGMSAEVLTRAFEPFFTTKDVGQGSGLGLSMVYGFARQSNGCALIQSTVGRGTTIEILLPQPVAQSRAANPAKVDFESVDFPSLTVLVVEDDPVVLKQVHELIRSVGCSTYVASGGAEALSVLEDHKDIDLLLTDVVMAGGVGGVELAQQALSLRRDIKVLFTSGYSAEDQDVMEALSQGAPILKKPYRRADLMQALSRVVGASL
jgi:PAS domain S-box-containing protein